MSATTEDRKTERFVLNLGKVDADGRGRKSNAVTIEVKLRRRESCAPHLDIDLKPCREFTELSVCGYIWNAARTDIIQGGQCLDSIEKFFPDNPNVKRLVEIWERWHLNGTKAGTREQDAFVKDHFGKERYDYGVACAALEKANLRVVGIQNYEYGHAWLVDPLPPEIEAEVRAICARLSQGPNAEQPDDFCSRNGITASCEMVDENPNIENRGANADNWKVTLRRGRKSMTVCFSKGIAHMGKEPTAIEVLGGLAMEAQGVDRDFEDWCGDYGYEKDSRRAERIYNAVVKQTAKLKAFLGTELFKKLMEETA